MTSSPPAPRVFCQADGLAPSDYPTRTKDGA